MATTGTTISEAVPMPARTRVTTADRSAEDGEETRILRLSLRRHRHLLAERTLEFVAEEAVLHAAVDDVPRQGGVGRPIAEHEEAGIDAGLRHGGAPVATV